MISTSATPESSVIDPDVKKPGELLRSMIPSAFVNSIPDKVYALGASLGVLLGIPWFVASSETESTLSHWGAAGCIAVCASVATAFLRTRASTIKARAEADASGAATVEAATAALIKRITDGNDRREAKLESDLDYARGRADTAEQIAQAEKKGKHDALETLWAEILHRYNLEALLLKNGIDFPEGPKTDFGKVVRAPDAATDRLLTTRNEAAHPPRSPRLTPPDEEEPTLS